MRKEPMVIGGRDWCIAAQGALAGVPNPAAFVASVRELLSYSTKECEFPELNMSNYDADDVSRLNGWGVRAALLIDQIAALLPPSPTSGE